MTRLGKKFNFKALLTLTVVLTLSLVLAFSTACSNKSGSNKGNSSSGGSKTEEEKPTDKQTVYNGDFEWYTDDVSMTTPYHTSIKWTRNADGSSADKAQVAKSNYGIIDTSETGYGKLEDKYKPDGTDGKFNPGTPEITDDTAFLDKNVKKDGKKVLMLRNSELYGTAQYMTSSKTQTIPAGTTGVFSVYVNTKDVVAKNGAKTGAYIKISGTVGSKSIENAYIENINTNGKWVRYVISVTPSATATTSLSISVGLGRGSQSNMARYADGFAYFDNASYVTVKNSAAPAVAAADAYDYTGASISADEYGKDYTSVTERVIGVNFAKSYAVKAADGEGGYNEVRTDGYEVSKIGKVGYASADTELTLDGVTETVKDAVYAVFPGKGADGKAEKGSSYSYTINKLGGNDLKVTAANYTLADDSQITYYRLSFLAKVKTDASSMNGASVTIMDNDGADASESGKFSFFTTTAADTEYTDGYVRYTFYLCTKYEEDIGFSVRFSFGPTDKTDDVDLLPTGYAVFKDFTYDAVTLDEYNASSSTNVVKASLLGDHLSDYKKDDDETKDTYTFSVSDVDAKTTIKRSAVNIYDTTTSLSVIKSESDSATGVVNSEYADAYVTKYGNANIKTLLDYLNDGARKTALDSSNKNKHVQPIMVLGKGGSTVLAGAEKSVSAQTAYEFTVKLRVADGTNAFVKLYEIASIESGKEDGDLKLSVNSADYTAMVKVSDNSAALDDGYVLVRFIVKTGKTAKKLRLEFGVEGNGLMMVGAVEAGKSSSIEDEAALKDDGTLKDYLFDGKIVDKKTVYYYKSEKDATSGDASKRLKDSDGDVREKVIEAQTMYVYAAPKTAAISEVTEENATIRLYRFDDVNYIIEAKTDDDKDDDKDDSTDSSSNQAVKSYVWLQIVSIIIAAAIIIALVAIIVRKAVDNGKRKKAKTRSYYTGYDQKTAHENASRYSVKNAKKPTKPAGKPAIDVQAPDEDDRAAEYDYGDADGENDDK